MDNELTAKIAIDNAIGRDNAMKVENRKSVKANSQLKNWAIQSAFADVDDSVFAFVGYVADNVLDEIVLSQFAEIPGELKEKKRQLRIELLKRAELDCDG